MMHHMEHMTAASWVVELSTAHGLDCFVSGKYILVPAYIFGLQTQYYLNKYHNEAKAVTGLDTALTDL